MPRGPFIRIGTLTHEDRFCHNTSLTINGFNSMGASLKCQRLRTYQWMQLLGTQPDATRKKNEHNIHYLVEQLLGADHDYDITIAEKLDKGEPIISSKFGDTFFGPINRESTTTIIQSLKILNEMLTYCGSLTPLVYHQRKLIQIIRKLQNSSTVKSGSRMAGI